MNRKHAVKQKELSGDFKGKLIFTSQTNPTVFAGSMNTFFDKLHVHEWLKEYEAAKRYSTLAT